MFDSGHKSQLMDGRREKFVRYAMTSILVMQIHKLFSKTFFSWMYFLPLNERIQLPTSVHCFGFFSLIGTFSLILNEFNF